jgi:hypothetical protein
MDLHDDPAVISIACRLNITEDEVVGKLVRFWAWASRHTTDGNADSVTEKWLDRYLGVTGMAQAMAQEGWLHLKEGGGITVPKFDRHNGDPAKKRAMTRLRVQKHRSKTGEFCNAGSVTEPLLEKRREEKSIEEEPPTPRKPRKRSEPATFPDIPAELNTPEFLAAWADWLTHRSQKRDKVTPLSASLLLSRLVKMGPVRAAAAIYHSIASGWKKVFEENQPSGPAQTPQAAARAEEEARRTERLKAIPIPDKPMPAHRVPPSMRGAAIVEQQAAKEQPREELF